VFARSPLTEPDMPERSLDQKRAHHAIAFFGDVPMSFSVTALSYPRCQSKIARKLLGVRKSLDGPNPAIRGYRTHRGGEKRGRKPFLNHFFSRSTAWVKSQFQAQHIGDPRFPVLGAIWRTTIHALPQCLEFGSSCAPFHPTDPVCWRIKRPGTEQRFAIPIEPSPQTAPAPILRPLDEVGPQCVAIIIRSNAE